MWCAVALALPLDRRTKSLRSTCPWDTRAAIGGRLSSAPRPDGPQG